MGFNKYIYYKKVRKFYCGESYWNTPSKYGGRSSNHTLVPTAKTALLVRAWASLFCSLLTCLKLHRNIERLKFIISSTMCPNIVLFGLNLLTASITFSESPSTSTWKMLISWAKLRAWLTATAFNRSTEFGRQIF